MMCCDFHQISPSALSQSVQLIGSSQPISLQPVSDLGDGLQFEQAVGFQKASTSHLLYQLFYHLYYQVIKHHLDSRQCYFDLCFYASSPALMMTTKSPQLQYLPMFLCVTMNFLIIATDILLISYILLLLFYNLKSYYFNFNRETAQQMILQALLLLYTCI